VGTDNSGLQAVTPTTDPIAKLLADSRIADEAAELAYGECDVLEAKALKDKSNRLRIDAERMDPSHESPAWKVE